MKTISNKTAEDIIRWLSDLKSRLPPDSIQSREKIRKIDKAIKILKMEKFLGQDIPENERWQFLQDNADAVEEIEDYKNRVIDEQLNLIREIAPDIAIIEI